MELDSNDDNRKRKDENEGINIFFTLLRIGLTVDFLYWFVQFMFLD